MSQLGSAVFYLTADSLGMRRGIANALMMVVNGLAQMSQAALNSSNKIVQGFGLVGAAVAALLKGMLLLGMAFGALAKHGAEVTTAGANIGQVFGRSTAQVLAGADEQARAFGRSKSEYLAYAAEIGRSLEMLGVSEANAAAQATTLLAAVSKLAESKGITFGQAFKETQMHGSLFTDEQVLAFAVQNKYLHNRTEILNAGTEALIRNRMAVEQITATTNNATGTGMNWNSQMNRMADNLGNLTSMIGQTIEPAFVSFLSKINYLLQVMVDNWGAVRRTIEGILSTLGLPTKMAGGPNLDEITNRNQQRINQAGQRQAGGEILNRGQGGGGGGFQGGLVEFARRIQSASFSQAQIRIQRLQLEAAQKAAEELEKLNRLQPWRNPANNNFIVF